MAAGSNGLSQINHQVSRGKQAESSAPFVNVAGFGFSVIGPVSGKQYHFARPGEQVQVDPRDREAVAKMLRLRQGRWHYQISLRLKLADFLHPAHHFAQLDDLQVGWTGAPVVYPADNDVSAVGVMAMGAEVAAQQLKFNAHVLIAAALNLKFGMAIGVAGLGGFNDEAKAISQHPKKKNYAELIGGLKGEAGQAKWSAESGRSTAKT
jgi:hypothetical protein